MQNYRNFKRNQSFHEFFWDFVLNGLYLGWVKCLLLLVFADSSMKIR